ncbi:MAG: DUF4430 domain-containing protein [Butyrivibrio sp.]|nr:DUF4430 domain-containing protein [Butyrivibrio sp.]
MQMKRNKKLMSLILCVTFTVAMMLFVTGCNGTGGSESGNGESVDSVTETGAQDSGTVTETDMQAVGDSENSSQQLGEGSVKFMFTVVDKDGIKSEFEIHTDKETVGEALLELGLIAGDESEYGLYVKTVNGITADYDKDGVYWAFYVDGEYAQTGVDSTAVTDGASYAFKVE